MNIVVLAGGYSPERDVSLTSGSLIANALIRRGHRVLLLDPYLGTTLPSDPDTLFQSEPYPVHSVKTAEPDLAALKAQAGQGEALVGKNVDHLCRRADVVYVALHGGAGEDGRLQGYLDCLGVPYTGTGALGAMLSMDKDIAKTLLSAAGIPTPHGIVFDPTDESAADRILAEVGLPCVIKPCSCGSSVGVSIVEDETQLRGAIALGSQYENRLLAEVKLLGRELTVGYLQGVTLPPMEIIPKEGFYDYKNKYQAGLTEELCPAPLTEAETAYVTELTARGFAALQLSGYARLDFILTPDGTAYCLEANALPGMTPTSLLPQMAAYAGLTYEDLCEYIVQLAVRK
jgi:D-alanine-D-alanine ligase